MKRLLIFIMLLLFVINTYSSETISPFSVRVEVPLGEPLTITGDYNNTNGDSNNILCSFFLRENDDNTVLDRLSDERTFSNGSFYSEAFPTEPLFIRGQTYNVMARCGDTNASASWILKNPKPIQDQVIQTSEWLKNAFLALLAFITVIVVIFFIFR